MLARSRSATAFRASTRFRPTPAFPLFLSCTITLTLSRNATLFAETCNFDAIFAYLTCQNYDFRYDLQKGLRPRRSVRTAMAHEINMYATVQKDQQGLDKAVEDVKYRMSRYSVTPNMMIVPPQVGLYLSLAPEEKLTYPLGGPAAQAAFEAGLKGFETRAFRGLGVMVSTPYEVSDDQARVRVRPRLGLDHLNPSPNPNYDHNQDSVQMLQRSTQVGEFYRMSPPAVFPTDGALPPSYMDIMIYDEESDRHVHIAFQQAIWATGYGGEGGPNGIDLFKLGDLTEADVALWKAHQTRVGGNTVNIDTLIATASAKPDKAACAGIVDDLISMVKKGIWVPIEICIARPFIEHLTLSAIVAVAGKETGATLFGPADMQISANTSVKTIEGASRAPPIFPRALLLCTSAERFRCGVQVTTRATRRA